MVTRRTSGPSLGAPLLAHLGKLTTDASAIQEFRHWFSNALWDVESGAVNASDDIVDLFYAIENMLGIYDAGFWTTDELVAAIHEDAHKFAGASSIVPAH